MPRRGKGDDTPGAHAFRRAMWAQTGSVPQPTVVDWDPDTAAIVQAIFEVLGTGCTVVFRPGGGRRSLGWAIWEGKIMHPPVWLYTEEELNDHARVLIEQARRGEAAD